MAMLSLVVVVEGKSIQASCLGRRLRAWDQARFATSLYLSPPPSTPGLTPTRAAAVHGSRIASELPRNKEVCCVRADESGAMPVS